MKKEEEKFLYVKKKSEKFTKFTSEWQTGSGLKAFFPAYTGKGPFIVISEFGMGLNHMVFEMSSTIEKIDTNKI